MNTYEIIMSCVIGLGLAAACGFRVFVPLLIVSIASRAGWVTLDSSMQWMGSLPALIMFAVATGFEIAAYYVPWIDNLLDTISTPTAVIAGSLASASFIVGMDPILQWSLAVIAGGGTALATQATTVVVRGASTVTTGGVGNPVVSTTELAVSTGLSLAAVLVPILAVVLLAVLLTIMVVVAYRVIRRRRARRTELQTTAAAATA